MRLNPPAGVNGGVKTARTPNWSLACRPPGDLRVCSLTLFDDLTSGLSAPSQRLAVKETGGFATKRRRSASYQNRRGRIRSTDSLGRTLSESVLPIPRSRVQIRNAAWSVQVRRTPWRERERTLATQFAFGLNGCDEGECCES
jgi:hypothetical protein